MSYGQGPIKPRHNDFTYQLPYINSSINGNTCDAEPNEIFISTPYNLNGATADGFSKIFVTNSFGISGNLVPYKNTISGFLPDFYVQSPTEIGSTWIKFVGNISLPGSSSINYEVIYILYNGITARVYNVNTGLTADTDIITSTELVHEIKTGGTVINGSGLYRKLGTISTH